MEITQPTAKDALTPEQAVQVIARYVAATSDDIRSDLDRLADGECEDGEVYWITGVHGLLDVEIAGYTDTGYLVRIV